MATLIPCAECDKSFHTFRQLKAHFNFYHPSITMFSCASINCLRTFQLFNSYRRHYINNHFLVAEPQPSNFSSDIDVEPNVLQNYDAIGPSSHIAAIPIDLTLGRLFASLYANPQIPQNMADVVYNAIKDMFGNSVVPFLTEPNCNVLKERILSSMSNLDSHHKRLKYFKQLGTYIEPNAYVVGQRYDYIKRGATRVYASVKCEAHIIPLRVVLKKFFSMPGILQKTLEYMDALLRHDSTQTLEHFMHGSFWKARQTLHENKFVMPFFLQVDEFEPLNVLGSHSSIHKLGAGYISLPCLPQYHRSQLSNIFLVLLYHTYDRIQFGNRLIFQPLIDEFNYLKKYGIFFDLPDFKGTIFFELGLILGDNLGLHSIIGFTESFSSNFSCRNCKVVKNDMIRQFREDSSLLRNMDNYREDLRTNNCSLTGVKDECIWLRVENFDLFSQIGVDVMHDLNEGVMKYVMCELIIVFVDKLKYFSIQSMNNKLSSFDYGPDSTDKPVSLSIENIRKGNIRLSASEMAVFCRYFGIMFGDMVPRHDKYWDLYIHLMLMLDVIMSSGFRPEQATYLQYLVAELCKMFTSLFNQTLKPKFHNLIHYHSAMLKFGPLRYLSSMRFEAKHRPNKLASKSSTNRINMSLSIAKRHQLMLNEIFLKRELNSPLSFGVQSNAPVHEASILAQKFGWDDIEQIKMVSWASVSSAHFRNDCVVIYKVDPHTVHFAKLSAIYKNNSSKIVFKALPMLTIAFDVHYYAYNVRDAPIDTESIYIDYDAMQYPFPCNIAIVGYGVQAQQYIILRKPL